MIKGLENLLYEKLRELGLFSLKNPKLWNTGEFDQFVLKKNITGGSKVNGMSVHYVVPCERKRGNGHKLRYRKFHQNIPKYFYFSSNATLEQVV